MKNKLMSLIYKNPCRAAARLLSHRLMQGVLLCLFSSFSYGAAGEHHHFAGIFLGYTNADSHTEFSYGIEYEYKFNQMWGTGFVYEKTDDAHHGDGVDITLGAIYLHPWKELRIGAGFGREKVGGAHSFTQDIKRLSLSYDFHIGGFGLAPTYALDFVDGHTARVFGIALIKAF